MNTTTDVTITTTTTPPIVVPTTTTDRRVAEMSAAQEYTLPVAEQTPPLGIVIAAVTEIASIVAAARAGQNIAVSVAQRLADEIEIAGAALNVLVPRPRQGRGLARWVRVEMRP